YAARRIFHPSRKVDLRDRCKGSASATPREREFAQPRKAVSIDGRKSLAMKIHSLTMILSATMIAGALTLSVSAHAGEQANAAALKEVEQTFGIVPTFMKQMPQAGLAGAWQQLKDLEFSDNTALSPKVKALIGLAVVAQIPCAYCIWADAASARQAGASKEEI